MAKRAVHENGRTIIITVPTCDTCRHQRSSLEMVAPLMSATVDNCRIRLQRLYPQDCPDYRKTLVQTLKDFSLKRICLPCLPPN